MLVSRGRHQFLAEALPIRGEGPIVDLGCGRGSTLRALRERAGPEVELVGVEKQLPVLEESLAADVDVRPVAANLRESLCGPSPPR